VPSGSYQHLDPLDGTPVAVEQFSCAAGPVGWRYVSTLRAPAARSPVADPTPAADPSPATAGAGPDLGRVDVTLDAGGRQLRVEVTAGGWRLRGGVAGTETVWLRDSADDGAPVERSAAAAGFAGRSPAFLVATARRLALSPGGRARVRLVALTEPALGTRLVHERWTLLGIASHPTETDPLPVARYEIADLDTGEVRALHLAGDVVVAATALELTTLTAPPSL